MFQIRYITDHDRTFWFMLDKHMGEEEFDRKVRDKRGYVISDNDHPIGIMRYNLFGDNIPFLTYIFINAAHRGKGFGRRALLFWEDEMRGRGHDMIMASTQVDEQAQHFYRKLGYVDRGSLFLDHTPFEQPQELFLIKVLSRD